MVKPKTKVVSKGLEEELGVTAPSSDQLKSLSAQIDIAVNLNTEKEKLEAMLKTVNESLHNLTTRTLPDIMRAAGTESFKTTGGVVVKLKPFMSGSIPKEEDKRDIALRWLEKNGAKDLIKTEFDVSLGRGQIGDAKKLRAAIGKLGLDYKEKEGVNAQSLYAFARERMKAAEEVPLELLGLFTGTVAKIDIPEKGD